MYLFMCIYFLKIVLGRENGVVLDMLKYLWLILVYFRWGIRN